MKSQLMLYDSFVGCRMQMHVNEGVLQIQL